MSTLVHLLGRLFAGLFSSDGISHDPDTLSLRDWADLPAHHPVRDRTPC